MNTKIYLVSLDIFQTLMLAFHVGLKNSGKELRRITGGLTSIPLLSSSQAIIMDGVRCGQNLL